MSAVSVPPSNQSKDQKLPWLPPSQQHLRPRKQRICNSNSAAKLPSLPLEILDSVVSHLPNHGIKNLRLACHLLHGLAVPHLDDIFWSANLRNIVVFAAVAHHDEFRKQITEIVRDDARLQQDEGGRHNSDSEAYDPAATTAPLMTEWSMRAVQPGSCAPAKPMSRSSNAAGARTSSTAGGRTTSLARAARLEAQMSRSEAWAYYRELLRQQDDVLRTGADVEASGSTPCATDVPQVYSASRSRPPHTAFLFTRSTRHP